MELGRSKQPSVVEGVDVLTIAPLEPAALGAILTRRLKRALLLRFYTESLLDDPDRLLLDRVIFSSYCDCQSIGLSEVAKRLLDEARSGSGLFRRPSGGAGGGSAWST
jgi:hypothetical protein